MSGEDVGEGFLSEVFIDSQYLYSFELPVRGIFFVEKEFGDTGGLDRKKRILCRVGGRIGSRKTRHEGLYFGRTSDPDEG